MDTFTATNARSNLFQILRKTVQGHLPTRVSCKEGTVVLISEEEYESLLETADLMSIPGLSQSVKKAKAEITKGQVYSFDEVFKE